MAPVIIALAAFAGGVLAAWLGYLDAAPEPFNPRQFGASVIRALFAGVVFAIGYVYQPGGVTVISIFGALIGGAGIDVLGNRISGAIKSRLPNTPIGPSTP